MPVDSPHYQAEHAAAETGPERDAQGRWQKGRSGNPAGRPRGSRNRASLMAQELLDASAAILMSKAIERAISGDGVALRFLLARILAPRRAPPIDFALPPLDTQQDLALAMAAVGQAAAEGEITPGEAADFARVVDTAMHAIQAREVEYHNNRVAGRTRSPAAPPPAPPPSPEVLDAAPERVPSELDRRSRERGNPGAGDAALALDPRFRGGDDTGATRPVIAEAAVAAPPPPRRGGAAAPAALASRFRGPDGVTDLEPAATPARAVRPRPAGAPPAASTTCAGHQPAGHLRTGGLRPP